MLNGVAPAFAQQPATVLPSPLFDGDFAVADGAPRGVTHHPQHAIVALTPEDKHVTERKCRLEHGRGADDPVIDQRVKRSTEPSHQPGDEAGDNRPLKKQPG